MARPTHIIRHVIGEGEKKISTRIGAAWPHKDGRGFNITLDYIPRTNDGFISMREPKQEEQ